MFSRALIVALVVGSAVTPSFADEKSDYEAKLKAAREAVYKKYLIAPPAPVYSVAGGATAYPAGFVMPANKATPGGEVSAPKPTGAALGLLPSRVAVSGANQSPYALWGTTPVYVGGQPTYSFGDLRYNFYDNLNVARTQRYTDYALAPYIYQPVYDPRYNRSWPRPVTTREYVKSHWVWDGTKYTFVPGRVESNTNWVMYGWPRYHWRGGHYSVSISFKR